MDNITISDKFGKMWKTSRLDAGKSQDYMAKALGVSKKTIQNWEAGYASPSQIMGFKWFEALDVPALPYYLSLLHGEFEGLTQASSDEDIKKALLALVNDMDATTARKLLFLFYGDHGSPIKGILELMVAYVHTPLPARIGVAELMLTNYNISSAYKATSNHIEPDTNYLDKAITRGMEAVTAKRSAYFGGDLE